MNFKALKQHGPLVAGLALFVVVLAGVLWQQQRALAQQRQVEEQLAAEQAKLHNLRAMRPFPSRENLELLRTDKEALRRLNDQLVAAVGGSKLETTPLRPITFSQQMAQRLGRLRQQAQAAGVALPENFAFGFSRYVGTLPCHSIRDEAERLRIMALLSKQLQVIDELSQLLIQHRVEQLRSIRRLEVEPGAVSADAFSGVPIKDPQGLYTALPFELQFACSAESLRQILNALAKARWFFTVRQLMIDTELVAAPAPSPATPATDGDELPKRSVLVVTMKVDLVEFNKLEAAKP